MELRTYLYRIGHNGTNTPTKVIDLKIQFGFCFCFFFDSVSHKVILGAKQTKTTLIMNSDCVYDDDTVHLKKKKKNTHHILHK